MNEKQAIVWKEWQESKIYLWIGLSVFVGIPLIAAAEALFQYALHFEVDASSWVIPLGGILAIFVAVGATCREFAPKLDDFWRSRPISTARLFILKYLVGLLIVEISCTLPLVLEWVLNSRKPHPYNDLNYLIVLMCRLPFLWAAVFSIAFFAGCLLRRTAHAAMFAIGALILLWFLPMIVPPLEFLSGNEMTYWDRFQFSFKYAAGMSGIAAAFLLLALITIKRNWHVESGRKLMYGSVSAALLLLMASAAFRLGTNLPILDEISMPPREFTNQFVWNGSEGTLMEYLPPADLNSVSRPINQIPYETGIRKLKIKGDQLELGEWQKIANADALLPLWEGSGNAVVAPEDSNYFYELYGSVGDADDSPQSHRFYIDTVLKSASVKQIHETEIGKGLTPTQGPNWAELLYAKGNRLYALAGDTLTILDITQPTEPKILSHKTGVQWNSDFANIVSVNSGRDTFLISLPPLGDLPARDRLEAVMRITTGYGMAFEGNTLIESAGGYLTKYRLDKLTDSEAKFVIDAEYNPPMLERVFGTNSGQPLLVNGLLYKGQESYPFRHHPGGSNAPVNPSFTIFETRQPGKIFPIAHFAAPGMDNIYPLPDGRTLVFGDKIMLIGPPDRSKTH